MRFWQRAAPRHMFPAHVLARELRRRGHSITLISDSRGLRFKSLFKDIDCHEVPSATLAGRGALGGSRRWFCLARVCCRKASVEADQSCRGGGFWRLSFPADLAGGYDSGHSTCIHEQNAVLGRVNRLLCRFVRRIALSFEGTRKIPAAVKKHHRHRQSRTPGNSCNREKPYPSLDDSRYLNLLVLGGSQGATILSTVVRVRCRPCPRPCAAGCR